MGQPVPAEDLPSGGGASVPAADLPSPTNETPVTGTEQRGGGLLDTLLPSPRGLGEAALAVGSGMAGQAIGGLAGLAGAALPGEPGQGARVAERVSSALTYEPRSKAAQTLLKVAELPSIPIHWAAEKVGDKGAEEHPLLGTAGKTAVEAIPLLLGARAAMAPKRPLSSSQQKAADARDAGYVMTPEEMGAGAIPKNLASLAGEPRLAKLTSRKNTEVATEGAKAELGIRPDAPLDLDTLSLIRKQEGAAYDGLRNIGQVPMDTLYAADVEALASKYKSAAKEFPGAEKLSQLQIQEINDVIRMLRKEDPAVAAAEAQGIKLPASARTGQAFEASGAVDMIGALREGADGAFRSGKNALGKVMRGGADALEAQIDRHLGLVKEYGPTQIDAGAIDAFRVARQRIAKTYAVEKALVGDEVNMQSLGRQVQQRKPLTGKLEEAGDFAREFERSSQKPTNMPTGATFADLGLAVLQGLRSGGGSLVLDALTAGARPVARHVLASRPVQALMDPRTNLSGPALETLGASGTIAPPQEKRR